MTEDEEEEYTCRICLEDELPRSALIAPCSCAGSSKWVHRECLDRWRTTREDRAFSRCTECLTDYTLIPRPEFEEPEMKNRRRRKYFLLLIRDIGGMFLFTQAIIVGVAFMVFAGDNHEKNLINQSGLQNYPRCFYYLAGLVITAAIVGVIGCIYLCVMGTNDNNGCTVGGSDCAYCCYGCGDTCSGCTCEGCTAGSCECGEAGPAIIILLGALAVIGAIIIVVAGVMFVQQALKNHASVLYKRGLATEFVVADLDAPDGGLSALPPVITDNDEIINDSSGGGGGSDFQTMPSVQMHTIVYSSLASSRTSGMDREEQGVPLVSPSGSSGAEASAPPLDDSSVPSAPLLSLAQRQELASRGLI